ADFLVCTGGRFVRSAHSPPVPPTSERTAAPPPEDETVSGHHQLGVNVRVGRDGVLSRRGFLRWAGAGAALSWFDYLALHADDLRRARKACILLWMAGGPSQFETFDPKPGADTQGPTRAIPTAVPGLAVAEHWARTARVTPELTVIRSMTSKEGNHG